MTEANFRDPTARLAAGPDTHPRTRESKARQIHAALKHAIVAGELPPDAALDKNELGARFGVSRLPVTTAIERLAFENLVIVEPQRGSYVARIRIGDVKQWMLVRRVLETELVGLCALNLAEAAIRRISRNLAYQRTAMENGDLDRFYELDVEFHGLLIEGLALHRVGDILESVRPHVDRVRRMLLPEPGRMPSTYREHQAIVDAITARDPAAAATAMRRHLDRVLSELELFAERHPSFFAE
jgi:DNA-binding GntR family transcriptional regulator